MSSQSTQNDPSTTLGVGDTTSGQQGATPQHETQAETGGSGGDGLTRNQSGETANAPTGSEHAAGAPEQAAASGLSSVNRGFQDTRGEQASPSEPGLGAPQTGGNQDERDLPPAR